MTGAEAGPCRSSVAVPWRRRRADDVPARLARFTDEFLGVIKELRDDGKLRAPNLHSPIARSTELIVRPSDCRLELRRGQLGGRSLGGRVAMGDG